MYPNACGIRMMGGVSFILRIVIVSHVFAGHMSATYSTVISCVFIYPEGARTPRIRKQAPWKQIARGAVQFITFHGFIFTPSYSS